MLTGLRPRFRLLFEAENGWAEVAGQPNGENVRKPYAAVWVMLVQLDGLAGVHATPLIIDDW